MRDPKLVMLSRSTNKQKTLRGLAFGARVKGWFVKRWGDTGQNEKLYWKMLKKKKKRI